MSSVSPRSPLDLVDGYSLIFTERFVESMQNRHVLSPSGKGRGTSFYVRSKVRVSFCTSWSLPVFVFRAFVGVTNDMVSPLFSY